MALIKSHEKLIAARQKSAPISKSSITVNKQGKLDTSLLDKGIVAGYAIVWGDRSLTGYKFIKGCCARSIQEHGPKSNAPYKIKFLNQHNQDDPMSLFEELEEDDYGLRFKTFPLDFWDVQGTSAWRLIGQLKSETINNFSHGFDWIWSNDKTMYDDTDDSIVGVEIQLFEISSATIPAGLNTKQVQSVEHMGHLQEDISMFIGKLPGKYRMQARQLFTEQHSFINVDSFGETKDKVKKVKKQSKKESPIDLLYLTNNL